MFSVRSPRSVVSLSLTVDDAPGQAASDRHGSLLIFPSDESGQSMPTMPQDGSNTPTTTIQHHDAARLLEIIDLFPADSLTRSSSPDTPGRSDSHESRPPPTAEPTALIAWAFALAPFWERIRASLPRKPVKRALLVGLKYSNYKQHPDQVLEGTHRDVQTMKDFLFTNCSFLPENITTLIDDRAYGVIYPTAKDIRAALHELVRDAHPGDVLFFVFCGHGYRVLNRNGSEPDGFDEVILGANYDIEEDINPKNGQAVLITSRDFIMDDEIFQLTIHLPPKCLFVALFDSCHSGTAMDLPKERKLSWGEILTPADTRLLCSAGPARRPTNFMHLPHATTGTVVVDEAAQPSQHTPTYVTQSGLSAEPKDMACSSSQARTPHSSQNRKSTVELWTQRPRETKIDERSKHMYATLISLSACADHQQTFEDHQGNGVLVAAFIDALRRNRRPKFVELLRDLTVASHAANKDLPKADWPHPQLGSLFEIGQDEHFEFCGQARCPTVSSLITVGLSASYPLYRLLHHPRHPSPSSLIDVGLFRSFPYLSTSSPVWL